MLKQVKHLDDTRVLFSLLEVLDYENLIQVNQAEIARDLGMQRQNVQRSIKRLMELGVILEGVKIGVSRSYRLNQASAGKAPPKAIGRLCTST